MLCVVKVLDDRGEHIECKRPTLYIFTASLQLETEYIRVLGKPTTTKPCYLQLHL